MTLLLHMQALLECERYCLDYFLAWREQQRRKQI